MSRVLTAEEMDVCRNLQCSVDRAFKSKRMLRILSRLYEDGFIDGFDPFAGKAALSGEGRKALGGAA